MKGETLKLNMNDELITIEEASKGLRYYNQSILRRVCASGKIDGAVRVGISWLIPKSALKMLKEWDRHVVM